MGTHTSHRSAYKIGEVSKLLGVKSHVLRYWESEFPDLRPMKTKGAHRVYRREDVSLALRIRDLVHHEGYTIPGAKRALGVSGRAGDEGGPSDETQAARVMDLLDARDTLCSLLQSVGGSAPECPTVPLGTTIVSRDNLPEEQGIVARAAHAAQDERLVEQVPVRPAARYRRP